MVFAAAHKRLFPQVPGTLALGLAVESLATRKEIFKKN